MTWLLPSPSHVNRLICKETIHSRKTKDKFGDTFCLHSSLLWRYVIGLFCSLSPRCSKFWKRAWNKLPSALALLFFRPVGNHSWADSGDWNAPSSPFSLSDTRKREERERECCRSSGQQLTGWLGFRRSTELVVWMQPDWIACGRGCR